MDRPPGIADPALFARLKQVRLEIANAEGVTAFVVFHDRSLHDMALTLLIAESAPAGKDLMIRLIVNLLVAPSE